MPLPPLLHSHKLYSHSDRLTFCNPPFYKEREVQNKTKQNKSCGFLFVFLKKQDACHVDKLAPSCFPWRDFQRPFQLS
jgi:23S rRNA A1618 N6-methylase RlmF